MNLNQLLDKEITKLEEKKKKNDKQIKYWSERINNMKEENPQLEKQIEELKAFRK